jgi:hypothetical protein
MTVAGPSAREAETIPPGNDKRKELDMPPDPPMHVYPDPDGNPDSSSVSGVLAVWWAALGGWLRHWLGRLVG